MLTEDLRGWVESMLCEIAMLRDCIQRAQDQLDEHDCPDLDVEYVTKQVGLTRQHLLKQEALLRRLPDVVLAILTQQKIAGSGK